MDETKKVARKSIVCTFSNHAPIRFWGEFEEGSNTGKHIDRYTNCLWDAHRNFGHHTIEYYACKSGKRIYFASFNSGEIYGSMQPQTKRTYLKDVQAIKSYFGEIDRPEEWYQVCDEVDPNLVVDSDLL